MTDILNAVVLGLIEGLTEFLPVSSTGHMLLAMPLLGIDSDRPPWQAFLYFIQIGAILAVIVYFARPLWAQIVHRPAAGIRDHLLLKLVLATIPAALIGLPIGGWIERHLERPFFVALALILGAGVMEWIERRFRRTDSPPVERVSLRQALLIGLAQCVAIIPGTSRAMATIMGGMLVGLSPAVATEFSFYLAIPTLVGAGLVKLVKHRHEMQPEAATILGVGFFTAFVVALLVVDGFMRFVRTRRLRPLAIYRVILGFCVLACGWYARHH